MVLLPLRLTGFLVEELRDFAGGLGAALSAMSGVGWHAAKLQWQRLTFRVAMIMAYTSRNI